MGRATRPLLVTSLLGLVAGGGACGRATPTMPIPPDAVIVLPPPASPTPTSVAYDLTASAGDCLPLDSDRYLNGIADTRLPADVRSRHYFAVVQRLNQNDLSVEVGARGLSPFGFALIRSGNRVHFSIDGPAFFETLPNFTYLEIFGAGEAIIEDLDSAEISIPFSGSFEYCVLTSEMRPDRNCWTTPASQRIAYSICWSSNHRLTLTRR